MGLHGPLSHIDLSVSDPAASERCRDGVDRTRPGLHHMAFHAASAASVDEVYERVVAAGGRILDPPAVYGTETGYSPGYYAAFFADPDGIKLEVVFEPAANPPDAGRG